MSISQKNNPKEKMKSYKEYNEQEKFRSFVFLLIGQMASLFGSSVVMFTIIWWITVESESAIFLSIASFLSFAPAIVLLPFTGVFADRWNKKIVIIFSDFLQAVFTLGLIILFGFGVVNIYAILILITLRGTCQAFHQPAFLAILPFMVPQKYFSKINSISYLSTGLLNVIAPVFASFLLIYFTIGQILWVDVITFLIALIPSILLKFAVKPRKKKRKARFKKEFKEGLLALKEVDGLIPLLGIYGLINFFIIPFYVLIPYFIEVTHSGTSFDLALITSLFQGGIAVGSIIVLLKKKWNKYVRNIIILIYIETIGTLFFLFSPIAAFGIIGLGSFIIGIALAIDNSIFMTLIQTIVAPRKLGRAMSMVMVITGSIIPISMFTSGFFAELFGIYLFFGICEIITIFIITIGALKTNILSIDKIIEEKLKKKEKPYRLNEIN